MLTSGRLSVHSVDKSASEDNLPRVVTHTVPSSTFLPHIAYPSRIPPITGPMLFMADALALRLLHYVNGCEYYSSLPDDTDWHGLQT